MTTKLGEGCGSVDVRGSFLNEEEYAPTFIFLVNVIEGVAGNLQKTICKHSTSTSPINQRHQMPSKSYVPFVNASSGIVVFLNSGSRDESSSLIAFRATVSRSFSNVDVIF